MQIQYCINSNI